MTDETVVVDNGTAYTTNVATTQAEAYAKQALVYRNEAEAYAGATETNQEIASAAATRALSAASSAESSAASATNSAGEAAASATSAINASNNAVKSSVNAQNHEMNAYSYATNAATSETNASTYADEAKSWAIGDITERTEGSAKYWAKQAETSAAEATNENVVIVATDLKSDSSKIKTVADNLADITTVGGMKNAVTNVSAHSYAIGNVNTWIDKVNNVSDNMEDVLKVSAQTGAIASLITYTSTMSTISKNIDNVNTVATNISDVNMVAGIKDDVTKVSNIAMEVSDVADIAENVTTVAENIESIKTAESSATAAAASATEAKNSATNAATSETNASTYATNAETSATNAATSETNASTYADEAKSWAIGDITERTEGSAKYWAEQAKTYSQIDDASETVKGIVKLSTETEADAGTDDTTAMTPLKVANVVADNVGKGLVCGFDGTLSSTTLTFTPADSYNPEFKENYEYEIDLNFSAVGSLADTVNIVIQPDSSTSVTIRNVMSGDSAATVGQLRQTMRYDTSTGYRWRFNARFKTDASGNKVLLMPATVTTNYYDYDFWSANGRFLEPHYKDSSYKNKTFIQLAQAGTTDVFYKSTIIIHPCSIRLSMTSGDQWYINYTDNLIVPMSILDTGSSLSAGKDYYLYLVPDSTSGVKIICSLNSSYPSGYSASNSRKIGGFHTECVATGTIANNVASGYSAGDIIPNSIWCLGFRPVGNTEGAAYIDILDKWAFIYAQSGTGTNTASVYGGTITDTRYPQAHFEDLMAVGYTAPDDNEFTAMSLGSNQETNIAGSSDPVTTGGHSDTAGRRMISTYFLEDCCGAGWYWLNSTCASGTTYSTSWTDITYTGGDFYGDCFVLRAGGRWVDGAHCGSGSRNGVVLRSALGGSKFCRGVSRNILTSSKNL